MSLIAICLSAMSLSIMSHLIIDHSLANLYLMSLLVMNLSVTSLRVMTLCESKFMDLCYFKALALVEEETRRYRPTKNYLEGVLPALNIAAFETPLMKTELDRVGSRMPMEPLSMKRYELPPPPAGKMTDITAWNECVDNSLAQLEHQRTRIVNLELMQDYGSEAWKLYNEILQKLVNQLQVIAFVESCVLSPIQVLRFES